MWHGIKILERGPGECCQKGTNKVMCLMCLGFHGQGSKTGCPVCEMILVGWFANGGQN